MSHRAVEWALQAEKVPAHAAMTLVGLAFHAHADGTCAYASVATLASYARKSERSVQRDLRELERLGLIREGDQSQAAWLPADRRPVVYDLPVRGDTHVTSRGDAGGNGVTLMVRRGDTHGRHGVTPTSPEPTTKPKDKRRRCPERSDDYDPGSYEWFDHLDRCGGVHG